MERKFLKDLGLTDDVIEKVMAENGKDITAQQGLTTAEADKLVKANQTIKDLQETVKKFDGVDVNKLKDDLATLQTKYDTDLKDAKLNFAIETKLTKEGAVNTKAVRALLDSSKISLDGDNLIGLDEQLKTLKESEKWAFSGTQTKDVPGGGGNPPTGTETKTPLPSGTVVF